MPTTRLSAEIISAAIEGFESQKRRIDEQIAELRQMLDGDRTQPTVVAPTSKRKPLSATARARIAEAQRKRWAASKKAEAAAPSPARKRRKLSAAGRKRIVEATNARWARVRAEAEKQPSPRKKAAKTSAKRAATKNTGDKGAAGPPAQ